MPMNQDKPYNVHNAYNAVILRRFFKKFQSITHHGVPICKYLYSPFIGYLHQRWNLDWGKKNLSYLQDEMNGLTDSDIYGLSDEPYVYDPNPNGVILLPVGFAAVASLYLPKERYCFISPNPAQKDWIKTEWPDKDYHSIEEYFRDDPKTVEKLTRQIAEVIHEEQDDPMMGSMDLFEWFKKEIPNTVRYLDAVQSLFETVNVGAVLTMVSITMSSPGNWLDSALNLMARAKKVPSLTLQHCLISDRDIFGFIPILATKKLVWGQETLDWYKKYGYPESRISIIGSTRFDIVFNRKWCGKEEFCQTFNIDPSKKIVIFTTQPQGIGKTILPVVLKGLAAIPDVFLAVILHHSENDCLGEYQQITAEYANCAVFPSGRYFLYDALSGADLFITGCSTSALEAMFFKLPVITVEPFPMGFSYGELGVSLCIKSPEEVHQVVTRLIADPVFRENAVKKYQEFIANYCMADGLSTKRLFDEIDRLCQTGGIA
jgi:hypothetical protein